jgi:hypothetical protein
VWAAWDTMDRRTPTLTDFHLMQVAHEARHAFSSKRPAFKSEPYTIRLTTDGEDDAPATRPTAPPGARVTPDKLKKAVGGVFRSVLGPPVRVTPPTPAEPADDWEGSDGV